MVRFTMRNPLKTTFFMLIIASSIQKPLLSTLPEYNTHHQNFSFLNISTDIIGHIVVYLGNQKSVFNLAKTSKSLHAVLGPKQEVYNLVSHLKLGSTNKPIDASALNHIFFTTKPHGNTRAKIPNLKTIELTNTNITKEILKKIITLYPKMQKIILNQCNVITEIDIRNHENLSDIIIKNCKKLRYIFILDCNKLKHFYFDNRSFCQNPYSYNDDGYYILLDSNSCIDNMHVLSSPSYYTKWVEFGGNTSVKHKTIIGGGIIKSQK